MKLFFTFVLFIILSLFLFSCSSDDDATSSTANIKFEVITSRNTQAVITITLNNDTENHTPNNLPFSFVYAQAEIRSQTFLKMTYLENGSYINTTGGGTSWTDYTATLNIYVDNVVVKSETFNLTLNNSSGLKEIEYTFE